MAAKITSCMKEAGLFLTRIPMLLAPFLLFVVTGFLHNVVKYVYTNPLMGEMSRHLSEMEELMDHSSAKYVRLVQEAKQDATSLVVISVAVALLTLTIAFAKQIFAASSATTHSSGSLAELLHEVTEWRNLKIPVIATASIVMVSQLLSVALLGASFPTAMHYLGVLSVQGSVILVAFLAFLNLGVMALISVGMRSKDKGCSVLVLLLLPTLLIPICAFGMLHLCTKQVMGLGSSLLSVYDLLQGAQDHLYTAASCVCCYCYQAKARKESSKEMVVARSRYFTYAMLFVPLVIMYATVYYITSKMLA